MGRFRNKIKEKSGSENVDFRFYGSRFNGCPAEGSNAKKTLKWCWYNAAFLEIKILIASYVVFFLKKAFNYSPQHNRLFMIFQSRIASHSTKRWERSYDYQTTISVYSCCCWIFYRTRLSSCKYYKRCSKSAAWNRKTRYSYTCRIWHQFPIKWYQ